MNRFIYLIPAFFVMLLLTACVNDDDTTPANELEGTWKMVSFEMDVETLGEAQYGAQVETYTVNNSVEAINIDYAITFSDDQFTGQGSYDLQQVYVFDGYQQVFTTPYNDILQTGSYSLDEDNNTITTEASFLQATANGSNIVETGGEPQTTSYTINPSGQLVFSQNETLVVEADNGVGVTNKTTNTIAASMVWEKE